MRGQFTPDVVFAMSQDRKLYPEDQQRVDEYLKSGYNDTPRKPFKP
ncbi:DUF3094 family protein, partial [Litorivivens sp.]